MNKTCLDLLLELETQGKIKVWRAYRFPEKIRLTKCIKDILEENPNANLYMKPDDVNKFLESCRYISKDDFQCCAIRGRYCDDGSTEQRLEINSPRVANTLTTVQKDCMLLENRLGRIVTINGNIYSAKDNPQAGRVYSASGISPTLDTCMGGNRMPKILEDGLRIRRLSAKECWRLMDFSDEDYAKAVKTGVSNTQLYKQAGNSIAVNVLVKIFEMLFIKEYQGFKKYKRRGLL
jgi:site-specific DNA-cytosine methylase